MMKQYGDVCFDEIETRASKRAMYQRIGILAVVLCWPLVLALQVYIALKPKTHLLTRLFCLVGLVVSVPLTAFATLVWGCVVFGIGAVLLHATPFIQGFGDGFQFMTELGLWFYNTRFYPTYLMPVYGAIEAFYRNEGLTGNHHVALACMTWYTVWLIALGLLVGLFSHALAVWRRWRVKRGNMPERGNT